MKFKYKTALYFFFIFFGGGLLVFRDEIQGEKQIVITIIALFAMMFGLYKMTSTLSSNRHKNYDNEEYFTREKHDQQEQESEVGEENVEETNTDKS